MISRQYVDELMHKNMKDYEAMNARQYRATVIVLCAELIKKFDEVEQLKSMMVEQ